MDPGCSNTERGRCNNNTEDHASHEFRVMTGRLGRTSSCSSHRCPCFHVVVSSNESGHDGWLVCYGMHSLHTSTQDCKYTEFEK